MSGTLFQVRPRCMMTENKGDGLKRKREDDQQDTNQAKKHKITKEVAEVSIIVQVVGQLRKYMSIGEWQCLGLDIGKIPQKELVSYKCKNAAKIKLDKVLDILVETNKHQMGAFIAKHSTVPTARVLYIFRLLWGSPYIVDIAEKANGSKYYTVKLFTEVCRHASRESRAEMSKVRITSPRSNQTVSAALNPGYFTDFSLPHGTTRGEAVIDSLSLNLAFNKRAQASSFDETSR
uniref:Uncharacterized protein n=1 Tax=Mucochytrium quahogii TaxID=96639 RepID=A0A7S2WEV8_9STRA|mmetsp:Transcript_20970/g.45844  ORF Transcript_20970/g.45844 Transcript_20970/m.45844 type:complete len:234 (+) Transcript_20970:87-788(+)